MKVSVVPPSATRRFYRLRYRDAAKVQHWRSTKTTSYEAAVRAAERWEREIEAAGTSTPERLTWEEFRQRFTEEAIPALADNTRLSYEASMNTLERLCKPRLLSDVSEGMLSTYAARLRPGRSETTIKSRLTNLSAVIGWACRMKLLPRMPSFPRIKRTNHGRPTPRAALCRTMSSSGC